MNRLIKRLSADIDPYEIPEDALGFLKFWQDKVQGVPEEFRHTCQIEYQAGVSWDSPTLEVTIEYHRPETDKEYTTRVQQEQDRVETDRYLELMQLSMLKKKYEDGEAG